MPQKIGMFILITFAICKAIGMEWLAPRRAQERLASLNDQGMSFLELGEHLKELPV